MEEGKFQSATGKIDVEIDGAVYSLKKPTMKEQLLLEAVENSAEKKSKYATNMTEYMVSLGLPLEVIEGLEEAVFLQVFNYITKKKKN